MNIGDTVRIRNISLSSKTDKIKGKKGTITGIPFYDITIDEQCYSLSSPLFELISKGINPQITYKQACQLEIAVYNLVVDMLKRSGLDPHSKNGTKYLGDPADWGEDIGEYVFRMLDDIGVKIVHIEGEKIIG